jgi:hypothetical protein
MVLRRVVTIVDVLVIVNGGGIKAGARYGGRHCVGGVQKQGVVQVRKWPEDVVLVGWRKRRKRRAEKQKTKSILAQNIMVDRVLTWERTWCLLKATCDGARLPKLKNCHCRARNMEG